MKFSFLVAVFSDRPPESIDMAFSDTLIRMFIVHATYNGAVCIFREDY